MTMLAPRWTTSRSARRLDGLWDFAFDACSLGVTEQWWCDRLPDSRPMPVPASYNDLVVDRGEREYVGDVWYQTRVVVPAGAPGRRTVLRFDAATHRAEVWVNDTRVGTHEGGYTPFEFDISALVSGVDSLRITVRVDNRLTMHSIPPGIVDVEDDGRLRPNYFHDFFNYAGLARSVWLISTPGRYIADIAVRTDLETRPRRRPLRGRDRGHGPGPIRSPARSYDRGPARRERSIHRSFVGRHRVGHSRGRAALVAGEPVSVHARSAARIGRRRRRVLATRRHPYHPC